MPISMHTKGLGQQTRYIMPFKKNEKKIFDLINKHRRSHGAPSMKYDTFVADIARSHSRDMAMSSAQFGHIGFENRVEKLSGIAYKEVSENVATYEGEPINEEIIVQFWLKSAKHRDFIEGNYQSTGIGISKKPNENIYFITQLFLNIEE